MVHDGQASADDPTVEPGQAGALADVRSIAGRRPRRVLFFGKNMSRSRATGGIVEALRRHGMQVKWLNMATLRRWMGRRLFGRQLAERWARRVFHRYQPDLVFVFCRDLPFALLQEFNRHATSVVWVEEAFDEISQDYADYLAEASVVFMTNPSKFAWLREHGVENTVFALEGFSSNVHYPVPTPRGFERDIVFIGRPGGGGRRAEFLAGLAEEFEVDVYGCDWDQWRARYPSLRVHGPVQPRQYRKLCASSRIVLGLNQVNSDALYFSNRTFLTLACGAFHLTHYVPGLERVFRRNEHLAWYHDLDDCSAQIRYFLNEPEERERIAAAGRELVVEHHQYYNRVGEILRILREGLPPLDQRILVPESCAFEPAPAAAAVTATSVGGASPTSSST